MKSAKAGGSESDDELTSGTRASSDQGGPAPVLDPSQLGVRIDPDQAEESSSSLDQAVPARATHPIAGPTVRLAPECHREPIDHADPKPDEQSSSGQDADDELETETLGQLTQRHRRVNQYHRKVCKGMRSVREHG